MISYSYMTGFDLWIIDELNISNVRILNSHHFGISGSYHDDKRKAGILYHTTFNTNILMYQEGFALY